MSVLPTIKTWLARLANAGLAAVMVLMIFLGYGSIANRWYRVVTIDGNSMSPTFYYGDAMIVTPPRPREQTPPGTILLMSVDNHLVTHRLVRWDGERPVTQGDANPNEDDFSGQSVSVLGVYWFHLPRLGYINLYFYQLMRSIRG